MECINHLTPKYGAHAVWRDFVSMTACAISNSVDGTNKDDREERYMDTVSQYGKAELDLFAEMFALTVLALEEDPKQDFLGGIFEEMRLGNFARGQHFTPYHIAELMSIISLDGIDTEKQIEELGYISVNDPACGAGVMFIAFANALQDAKINYQTDCLFVAEDIDLTAVQMCYIQLSLLGCPGYVVWHNSLVPEPYDKGHYWYTPFYFTEIWHQRRQITLLKNLLSSENNDDPETDPGGDAA